MAIDTQLPTLDEVNTILGKPEPDELENLPPEEAAIAAKLLPLLTAKANQQAEATKAKELQRIVMEIRDSNEERLTKQLEEIRKSLTPPSPEEIQSLLGQAYAEFKVKLRNDGTEIEFTIAELPVSVDVKVIKLVQSNLAPHMKEVASMEWNGTGSVADRIVKLVGLLPSLVSVMAEIVALSLNPFGKEDWKFVTKDWVEAHLSMYRIATILEAQIEAGKYRDFLSRAFRYTS